ncbi:MAG: hypothetical protein R3C11_06890 [Planctomycetaceae bacterium]
MHGSPHHRPEHLFSGLAKLVDRLSVPDDDAAVYSDNLNTFSTRISVPRKPNIIGATHSPSWHANKHFWMFVIC